MPRISTKFFGELDCEAGDVYTFPSGLPGFENEQSFYFLTIPGAEPLLLLQSASSRNLCFVLLPVLVIDQTFRLELSAEEAAELRLPTGRQPVIGKDILCAAMVCTSDGQQPTANLMSPVVVNLHENLGLQVIHSESGYSHRHPVRFEEALAAC
jgi:flagellar assembly factor FliW